MNFWILPVEVFGRGPNITVRGALKWARRARQKAMISSTVALASGFRLTKAHGVSPHIGSGRATTAASRFMAPEVVALYAEGLRRAGMPEE